MAVLHNNATLKIIVDRENGDKSVQTYWLYRIDQAKDRRRLRVIFMPQNAFSPTKAMYIHSLQDLQDLILERVLKLKTQSRSRKGELEHTQQKLRYFLKIWEDSVIKGWIKRLPDQDKKSDDLSVRQQESFWRSLALEVFFNLDMNMKRLREMFPGRFYYDRVMLRRCGLPWMVFALITGALAVIMSILNQNLLPYSVGGFVLSLFLGIEAYIKGFFA